MDRPALALLTTAHIVDDLSQGSIPAMLPFFFLERGYNYAELAGLTLASTLLSSVLQPVFGLITDRRAHPSLVWLGPLVAGLGIAWSGLIDNYLLTWLAIAISGIGVAAFHPEASRAARVAGRGTALGISWFTLGGNAGHAIAPIVVTPILVAAGLTGTLLLAIPSIILAIVVGALVPRWLRRTGRESGITNPRKRTRPTAARQDNWRAFGWLTAMVMSRSVIFFGIATFLALYVNERFGQDPIVGGAALVAFSGFGILGTLTGGWLADRFGRVRIIRLGYLIAIPGLLALLLAPTVPLCFAAIIVLSMGMYVPYSVQVTLGQEFLPNRIGTASGVTIGLAASAGGLVAPLLGLIALEHGLPMALAALIGFASVALLLSVKLPNDRAVARSV